MSGRTGANPAGTTPCLARRLRCRVVMPRTAAQNPAGMSCGLRTPQPDRRGTAFLDRDERVAIRRYSRLGGRYWLRRADGTTERFREVERHK